MNKEEVYDSQINPLMAGIINICREHGIAMAASFAIPTKADPSLVCTSTLPDETGKMPEEFIAAIRTIRGGGSLMIRTKSADGSETITAVV